jgi:hypothetical protein
MARATFETRRLRKAVEAYRFARGHWPDTLAELAETGWLSEDALAAKRAAPYHVARREGALIVLAQEH